MHALFLPGNSKESNEPWIYDLASTLKPLFDKVEMVRYKHWDTGEKDIALVDEVRMLADRVFDSDLVVIAKSAGVLVALQAMKLRYINPQKCIFIGLPIHFAEKLKIDLVSLMKDILIPIHIIQKITDPAGNLIDVKNLVADTHNGNVAVEGLPGNTHDYSIAELCGSGLISKYLV